MNKKDIVLKKRKNSPIIIGLISTVIMLAGYFFLPVLNRDSEENSEISKELYEKIDNLPLTKYKAVDDIDGIIKFPISSFNDEVQYYQYEFDDKAVKFFLLKSNDGTIRAAFDACDVCYRAKRGYNQVGDFMKCNNCGMTFPEDKINVVLGGCNPSPLDREVVGDNLVISVGSIELGKKFF